ncbi:MAG: pitrilysin family protein [Candidatus Firestonebacteria bacterium]
MKDLKIYTFTLLILQFAICNIAFAGDVFCEKLPNGMSVILKENPGTKNIALQVWVKVGASSESEENNGISHFIEHLLFKGTQKRGPGKFDEEISSLGGRLNGSTSKDFTNYHLVVASEFIDLAIDGLADIVKNPIFEATELEKERKVVIEEANRQNDNPNAYLYNIFNSNLWGSHPYFRTVIGTEKSLLNLKREDILAYYKKYYIPKNLVIVAVGDFKVSEMKKKIESAFNDFTRGKISAETKTSIPVPLVANTDIKREALKKDVKQTYYIIGWQAPDIKNSDNYAMDVLATILGNGRSSRFYTEIKEKEKLCSDIGVSYHTMKDGGMFMVYAMLDEKNISVCESAILREIKKLQDKLVTEVELNKAKTLIETSYVFSNETNENQAFSLGYSEVLLSYTYELGYLEKITKISADDIKTVVKKYLNSNSYTTIAITPKND